MRLASSQIYENFQIYRVNTREPLERYLLAARSRGDFLVWTLSRAMTCRSLPRTDNAHAVLNSVLVSSIR